MKGLLNQGGTSGGITAKTTVLLTPEEIDAAGKEIPIHQALG